MIPISLSLQNFLSYGSQVPPLDFTQFRVACLTGDNGHGKSALLDAMTYALWGEARKNAGERKPDEGLLRLGAAQMQVELCFELDDERFRVMRSFRKGRRVNSTQLELQIFDPAADAFRSLSDSSSLTRTQEHIERLLCMDYDTFINSAFLLQGRSDEFSQKNARQRKEILGQILGLARYDQLQDRARGHFQATNQAYRSMQERLDQIDTALAPRQDYEQQLVQLDEQLTELASRLKTDGERLETLRRQREESAQIRGQLESGQREQTHLTQRRQTLEQELEHLRNQQRQFAEILDDAPAIQRDFDSFQTLTADNTALNQKTQQLRELETVANQLESRITQERHDVEKRREKWQDRQRLLEDQLRRSRDLLERAGLIEARYQLLLETRQQRQDIEDKRAQHQTLERQRDQAGHALHLEKQHLTSQQQALQTQSEALRQRLDGQTDLEERTRTLESQVTQLQAEVTQRDQLREQGGELRARLQQGQHLQDELAGQLEGARDKIQILQRSSQAACPLCGSSLDETHRHQLDEELQRQAQDQQDRVDRQRQSVADLEVELQTMRHNYQELEHKLQPLESLQQQLAEWSARLNQLAESRSELQQYRDQIGELERQLAQEEYGQAERTQLQELDRALDKLDYQPDRLQQLDASLAELADAEVERQRLQDARTQLAESQASHDEASEKLELAEKYLRENLYAPTEQRELAACRERIEALAYDGDHHTQVRRCLDELSDAVARRERLIAAQQRHLSTEENIAKNSTELEQAEEALGQFEQQHQTLAARLASLGQVEEDYAGIAQGLEQARTQREQLLQRQGALQTQFERCLELTREGDQLKEKMAGEQHRAWLYQQLDEAFGKDGIQALIIENAVPEIEQEANAILARLTDNRIQIAIESLRDLKKGGTRETLDIKIADEIGERSYHLYSGGEAFRTNFALRIALSKVLARRSGTRLRTLIIDEGFGTQDQQGMEYLVQAIQEISKDFDKMLVVTHLPELKNAFPVQIEVTKHPDIGSRFKIIKNN
ncbi:MAG: hypothetical protein GKR89_00380 [Candidatus Latescibacteria bacterium]|nr:hypothetical protein [Candidatus Latescibacterota bacterium]